MKNTAQDLPFRDGQDQNTIQIHLYTDGGCQGNPGPGAWAALSYLGEAGPSSSKNPNEHKLYEFCGSTVETTNNKMELQAVIEGLKSLPSSYPQYFGAEASSKPQVAVYTDSLYVKNGITTWIHTWKRNSWRTSSKSPVKNRELWQELERQVNSLRRYAHLDWHWVKGHTGDYYNERCDELVRQNFPY